MNKISILGLSAFMALGFAACDGYEEPNPAPTTNEQESIVKPDEVSFTQNLSEASVADLRALNNEDKPLTIATVTGVIPEGYEFVLKTEFSADGGAKWFEVPSTAEAIPDVDNAYAINVDPDELDGLYIANVTKKPDNAKIETRYKLYTQTGGMLGLIDLAGGQKWLTGNSFELKPMGPGYIIENEYYIVLNGDLSKAVKLDWDKSLGDNVYDNPVFSKVVELSGTTKWQIVPASTIAAGSITDTPYAVWGVAADAKAGEAKGTLVGNTADTPCAAGEFTVTDPSPYMITVNMYDRTFEWSMALVNIYCSGSHNKNNPTKATPMGTTDYQNYYAYINLTGVYRFLGQPSNNGLMWGYDDANKDASVLVEGGKVAFPATKGFYFVQANIVKLTTKLTEVESFGIIGDATPGGWSDETPMTMVAGSNGYQWEMDVTLGTGEFKFRANKGWDVNLGGELGNLTQDGANIVATPGTYHIVLDLGAYPIAATLTAK